MWQEETRTGSALGISVVATVSVPDMLVTCALFFICRDIGRYYVPRYRMYLNIMALIGNRYLAQTGEGKGGGGGARGKALNA